MTKSEMTMPGWTTMEMTTMAMAMTTMEIT